MLEDSMRSNCQVVLLLLVAVSSLSSQSAAPPSNPLGTSSNCDSVLKATAPPRFRTGRLKHTAIPKYPAAARDANLSGKVRLSATIGKDGKVRDVTVLEGNPVLADAAAKAIREWRYEPFRLDNVKVDVPTVVTVNFEANGQVEMSQEVSDPVASNAMPSASSGVSTNYPGPVYKVGGDVKPPRVLDSPDPSYAESARKAKLQGSVVLAVVVMPEGGVGDIDVCRSLDPALDQKAVEAVTRWKFQPATKESSPVAVRISVVINFRLY